MKFPFCHTTIRIFSAIILIFFISEIACAESTVHLLCKGDLTQVTDKKTESKPTSLDVELDFAKSSVNIKGYWGCLADMGQLGLASHEYKCLDRFPVSITDTEVKYHKSINNPKYATQSSFVINRHSATITIASSAISQPASEAIWSTMLINGKLECAKVERKF
jgi:hypothetical protein